MMTQENFLEKMVDLLDTEEEITMETVLADIEEWDSLSFVSFLAMASAVVKKKIEPSKVRDAIKIQDLYLLLEER